MKKIAVEKEEGIAEVVDRMLGEPDAAIALVIPKGSVLGRSVSNFHLLAREANTAGKSVFIESVDDTILAFAKQSGLESSHPLWRGVRGAGGISDIIPADRGGSEVVPADEKEEVETRKKTLSKRSRKKVEPVKLAVREEKEEEMELEMGTQGAERQEGREEWEEEGEGEGEIEMKKGRRIPRKFVGVAAAVLVLAIIIFSVMTWSFGYAAVTIDFKKTPWEYEGSFLADKSVSKINAAVNTIPAQVFTAKKNMTQLFPASGRANVSIKAQGTITIYNAYSSAAQQLVATTRFVTPNGKIFRIIHAVTVPGAKITDGKIAPSSIDAPIAADQAGPDYNVGPVDKLMIPGFQGSPKYNAFYGKISGTTTGGFTGKKAVPTAADIADAKTKTTEALHANLRNNLTTSYPNNFKILEGATNVAVTKLTVSTTTDASGSFAVFGEAALRTIGFDEAKFKDFLLDRAQTQKQNSVFDSLTLTYSNIRTDFIKGTMSFSLSADGALKPAFSTDDFRANIAGKGVGGVRAVVAALPDLAGGKISVWPMWLWKMPSNPHKIKVTVN